MKIAPSLLLLIGLGSGAGAAPLPLLPAPAHLVRLEGQLSVTPSFRVATAGEPDPAIAGAIGRMIAAWNRRSGLALSPEISTQAGQTASLLIECPRSRAAWPSLDEDESYRLNISPRQAVLAAKTLGGVVHGLATLQQLLAPDSAGWRLPAVSIDDRPRFPWRGLLIDVSRRWKPVEVIERNLDGMALVKLNVLHFHLTDDQGFRVESKSHPELTQQGSDGLYYTQAEIRGLVAYAAARGIRVVPEFDLPGHATSWLVSHPELASGPGPYLIERHWGVFDPVMDPTNERTYALLQDVFTEMAALFPDPYFHLGGDENNGVQWTANPRIQTFIREHRLGDNPGLQAYFNRRAGAILARLGKKMIGWDEILHPDLPAGDVIESWRGADGLAQAAHQGFAGILAHGFYLDLCHPAADYYRSDPLPAGSPLSAAEKKRVLGGEASIWGEWVSGETIDSRIWPSAAAVAERLWSPADVREEGEMYRRLEIIDLRLEETGTRQRSYLAPAIDRLLDGARSKEDADALARFIALLAPVQNYVRGKQQPDSDQWTPLIGVADVARPDSPAARHFASRVKEYLSAAAAPGEDSAKNGDFLEGLFASWQTVGDRVAGSLAGHSPGVAAAAPLAIQLTDAAGVGREALAALRTSPKAGFPARERALARLQADSEPHDAAVLAVIDPIRQLVLAAAAP